MEYNIQLRFGIILDMAIKKTLIIIWKTTSTWFQLFSLNISASKVKLYIGKCKESKLNSFSAPLLPYRYPFSSLTLLRSVRLHSVAHLYNVCMYVRFLPRIPSSNWLLQVMWHKNYWWHHSKLSTRPNDSTRLVTSVKASFCRPQTD